MIIEQMEAAVAQERAAIAALRAKISDAGLLKEVQQVSFWLDDVEGLFLRSARKESRTPEQLERWLSYAAAPLSWATQKRKNLEGVVAKYGPKAVAVGG